MSTLAINIKFVSTIFRSKFRLIKMNYSSRKYKSALFIPGSRASETFSLLSPYLDFDKRFADINNLQRELLSRKSKINAHELKKSWDYYKKIDSNRKIIEQKREEVSYAIKKLRKKNELTPVEEQEMEGLKIQGTILRQDLRNMKEVLWEIEESVIVEALKLPNEIDDKTPLEPVTLRIVGEISNSSENNTKSHIDIGESLKLIEYKSPLQYYLCNEAAQFELGVTTWASSHLSNKGILRVSGTDFSRSLIVEAAGLNHQDPLETFILENNEHIEAESCSRLHLIGGASLVAFLSMHTKQLINPKQFPLRYFATGRQYTPFNDAKSPSHGLFGVSQATVVHYLSMIQDPKSKGYQNEFNDAIEAILELYDSLNKHYRVVLRSAGELQSWECLRVSFEMWSPYKQEYIEVGHLSCCDNYFSKRLLIAYQTPTGRDYPAIISGTVLSIPKLLGCLIEEDSTRFEIPKCIIPYTAVDEE